jgi:hypothetical protein
MMMTTVPRPIYIGFSSLLHIASAAISGCRVEAFTALPPNLRGKQAGAGFQAATGPGRQQPASPYTGL